MIYEFRPATESPTAKWILVLFYPAAEAWTGRTNRLRVLLGSERFFYVGRLRMAECGLGAQGGVYQVVINNASNPPLPEEPELWIINPDTHQAAEYVPAQDEPPLESLTQAALRETVCRPRRIALL